MASKKHDFTVAEIKAGIMVLVSAVVLVVFVATIEGYRPPAPHRVYVCRFKDTLGLNRGADVRFGGLKVGRVLSIEADPDKPELIRVEAMVPPELHVNADSIAYVGQTTLTAEKHLEITTGKEDAPILADGAEIPVREGGLLDQAGQLAGSIQSAIKDVQALLGVQQAQEESPDGKLKSTVATVVKGVDNAVEQGTGLVTDTRDAINKYRGDLDTILERVKEISAKTRDLIDQVNQTVGDSKKDLQAALKKVPPILDQIAKVSDNLDDIAASLQKTLDNSASLTGEAKDTIADSRPVLEDTLSDLRETVRHLRDFSRTIAEEPQAVIRGAGPQGRKVN